MIRPQEFSNPPFIYANCFHCETDVGQFFGQVHTTNGFPVCNQCKDREIKWKPQPQPKVEKAQPTNDMCGLRKAAFKVLKPKGVAWVDVCRMSGNDMRKVIEG